MYELKNICVLKFDKKLNFDKFDLIIKIHRFFGIAYYGYYPNENKLKLILFGFYSLFIYAIILSLCSPCLITDFNCNQTNTSLANTEFRQAIIFLIVRNFIAIISSINYSLRGREFAQIIDDLRKIFYKLYKNRYQNQLLRIKIFPTVLMLFFLFFVIISLVFTIHKGLEINFLKFISILISECYLQVLYFSTDFYVVYFTLCLVLLQNLFTIELRNYQKISLTVNDINAIEFKLKAIQSLIDRISNLLSPLLLFVFGAIFYDLVTCLYFVMNAIKTTEYLSSRSKGSYCGLIVFTTRLFIICFNAERLAVKVFLA
jgi:hypothetical protein